MIFNFLLIAITLILGAIFSWLPSVTVLPPIVGYDLDGALVTGVGQMHRFFEAFWPLGIMFQGFIVILGFSSIMLVLRFLIGHRAPK